MLLPKNGILLQFCCHDNGIYLNLTQLPRQQDVSDARCHDNGIYHIYTYGFLLI